MNERTQQQADPLFVAMVSLVGQAKQNKSESIPLYDVIRALDMADRKRGESQIQEQIEAILKYCDEIRITVSDHQKVIDALTRGDATPGDAAAVVSQDPPST